MSVPTILFSSPVLTHPPKSGPDLRIENSIKALARISDLHLYSRIDFDRMGGETACRFYSLHTRNFFQAPVYRSRSRFGGLLRRVMLRLPLVGKRFAESERDFQDLVETAHKIGADIIWLGYGNISYPLLRYIKLHCKIPVVIDTDSVWSRFVLRGQPFAKNDRARQRIENEGRSKEEEEAWGTCLADLTTAVSEIDAEYYRALTDHEDRVQLFRNVIDLDNYRQVPAPQGFKNPSIYLAGTFWKGSPMEDASRWLVERVMPLLRGRIPGLHCYIAGRGSDRVLSDVREDDVTIVGAMSSPLPWLTNATVTVVPLRFESGTRFKILEAGACSIPVVSTTLGAEGIPVTNGVDIMLADTPKAFADAIVTIVNHQELARAMGVKLKKLVADNFSLESLAKDGERALEVLLKKGSDPND